VVSSAASAARRSAAAASLEVAGELVCAVEALDLGAAARRVLEDRLDRAAVLSHQPLDRVEALLDLLEPSGLGLYPVQIGAQLTRDVGELDGQRAGALGDRVEARVDAVDGAEQRLGLGKQRGRPAGVVLAGHPAERAARRGAQGLGVAQALALRGQIVLLLGVGARGLDLLELEAQQVEIALARALALAQLGELNLDRRHLGVRLAVLAAPLEVRSARKAVEDLELRGAEGQLAVLVLAVEGEQPRPERAQVGRGRRAAADEGARSPRHPDAAAEHDLVGPLGEALGDVGELGIVEQALRNREHALNVGFLRARPDDLWARLAAHEEVERMREYGLSRAGLACDHVETLPEAQFGALDQQQALDPQFVQHALQSSNGDRRIRPGARRYPAAGGAPWPEVMSRWRTRASVSAAPTKATIAAARKIVSSP
jgi:hypothetical protein